MSTKRELLTDVIADRPSLDGMILFTDGMHSVRSPSFFEYFGEVSPVADRNCLLVTESGAASLVVNLPRDVERIRRHSWVTDVRGTNEFTATTAAVLDEYDCTGILGIGGTQRMPKDVYDALQSAVDTLETADDALLPIVETKSQAEIETFRKLGKIADAGFRAAYETVRPGMKEYEIAAEVEHAMHSAGADDNFNLFGTGPRNQLMHSPTERIVKEGDTFLCELSPMYDGYLLQICRTIAVGSPDPTLAEKHSLLQEALRRTKSQLSVGDEASVISKTMNDVFRREGYDEYCQPPYMRTRGHEFGFGPIGMAITEETDVELQDGMILVIHPNQFIPETGYLALGDPILMTDNGAETLTSTAPRLFTKEVVQ